MHSELFSLVKTGNVDQVLSHVRSSCIDVSQVIDEAKNFYQTLVFSACTIKNADVALQMTKVLTELGANPAREDSLKQTPLFYASREGHIELINFLCKERGDQVNRQDKYGQTALYYSAREGHIKVV